MANDQLLEDEEADQIQSKSLTKPQSQSPIGIRVAVEERKVPSRMPEEIPEELGEGASDEDHNDNPYLDFVQYRSQSARLHSEMQSNQLEWQDADYARVKATRKEKQYELLAYQSIHQQSIFVVDEGDKVFNETSKE